MGMLVQGSNLIRDFWIALNDAAELGTGTTQETAQDTDLQTPVTGSETTDINTTTANQFVLFDANFHGTSADGQSITEMIWKTQSPEKASSRLTFPAVTWQTDRDTHVRTRYYFRGRRG